MIYIRSVFICLYFFFSSRRRHTRFSRDWSSDVCSSDLAVVAVEGRDEQERHRELGQARADEELAILPVLAVGGGRHRDDGHGADLGGEEGQTGGPPRDAAPGEEEVAGVPLLAGEDAADDENAGERDEEDRVVGPRQAAAGSSGHGQGLSCPAAALRAAIAASDLARMNLFRRSRSANGKKCPRGTPAPSGACASRARRRSWSG